MATLVVTAGTGDGSLYCINKASWADAVNADGTSDILRETTSTAFNDNNMLNASKYYIGRVFLPFDTSALTGGAVITSAKLGLSSSIYFNADSIKVYLVSTTLTSVSADTDFARANWGMADDYGNADLSNWSPFGTRYEFDLTASGLAAINKTGTTYFGLVGSLDRAGTGTAPTGINACNFRTADYSSGGNKPVLTITYQEAHLTNSIIF